MRRILTELLQRSFPHAPIPVDQVCRRSGMRIVGSWHAYPDLAVGSPASRGCVSEAMKDVALVRDRWAVASSDILGTLCNCSGLAS